MKTTSRRAVLAGIAAAPALAVPALAATVNDFTVDPIFAAIEKHKEAFRIYHEAARVRMHTVDAKWSPEYDADALEVAQQAEDAGYEAHEDAAYALTEVRPTTMAGVLALLRYVEDFNSGAFFLEPLPGSAVSDWQSSTIAWPADKDENGLDVFGYAFLANARAALEAIAAS